MKMFRLVCEIRYGKIVLPNLQLEASFPRLMQEGEGGGGEGQRNLLVGVRVLWLDKTSLMCCQSILTNISKNSLQIQPWYRVMVLYQFVPMKLFADIDVAAMSTLYLKVTIVQLWEERWPHG